VIDVGANKGQFALYARVRFPQADVYSLEPLSGPRRRLAKLFADNGRVHVIAAAAGSAPGTARINVSRADDSSSLLPVTSRQLDRFPGTDTVGQESVQVGTLDRIFEPIELARPVLLKLDVQGFELEALRGAGQVLASVDTVLTECSFVPFYSGQALFEEVREFLRGHGFRLVGGAVSSAHDRRWEQGDFVFERPGQAQPAER
jgi:FkbM family methyltransferase